jgi:3-oxoacyl-[acyl-carrier protein] reductase
LTTNKSPLNNKNIIITGASRGLGKQMARTMWSRGASLFLIARSQESLDELRNELIATAGSDQRAVVLAANLNTSGIAVEIVQEAIRQLDRIDVLVNNAAILGPIGKVWENDWQAWEETIRINLLTPISLCRECVTLMMKERQGKIINLSGGGATSPRPNFSAYATAKAGLVRFSETLAQETMASNIQVNCIAPGVMNTEMMRAVLRAGPEIAGHQDYNLAVKSAEGIDASLQRAADLSVFLASSAGDGITGKLISSVWDPWEGLPERIEDLQNSDIYTLRRIVPQDRAMGWG